MYCLHFQQHENGTWTSCATADGYLSASRQSTSPGENCAITDVLSGKVRCQQIYTISSDYLTTVSACAGQLVNTVSHVVNVLQFL